MKNNKFLKVWLPLLLAVLLLVGIFVSGCTHEGEGSTATCTYCDGTGLFDGGDCENCEGLGIVESESNFAFSIWALVPPLVAIALALITKEVYSSLFIGILLGCFLYSNGNPIVALDTLTNDSIIAAISDNAGIFLFLVQLGILVVLINRAGGSAAFGRWAEEHIKSRTGAMLATFILGVLIFVDDYFNCLTVGSVMLPITDSHHVSRAKLAYLIDATAAPICMVVPISSWAAAVTGVVEGQEGMSLFMNAIPWNYYSILSIVFIVTLCIMKVDYGPMKLHEINALLHDDLYTTGDRVDEKLKTEKYSERGRVFDLIIPIIVLIVFCVLGLIYVGGFFTPGSEGYMDFKLAFGATDAFVALPWGTFVALIFTIIYFILRKTVDFSTAMKAIPQGFINMVPAITILVLASGLKNVVNGMLGAKYFIANIMSGAAAGLFLFLPAIIFIVGCILSFSTGTSWGTFGILIPIVSVMFTPGSTLFYIGISACLAGAVFGDHCSPISDTTIMASAGARCNHVNHVSTQLPYAGTVGIICFVNYILAGLIQNVYVCMAIGIVLTISTLFVIRIIVRNKDEKSKLKSAVQA